FYLEQLLATYPDAMTVQTHRDPARVLPSVTALLLAMRHAGSEDAVPPEKIARANMRAFAEGLERAIEFRRSPEVDARFHDIGFRELVADPLGTVRALYHRFRLSLGAEAEAAMRAWLDDPASHAVRGRHTLEQYGLSTTDIDGAFGSYLAQYRV